MYLKTKIKALKYCSLRLISELIHPPLTRNSKTIFFFLKLSRVFDKKENPHVPLLPKALVLLWMG